MPKTCGQPADSSRISRLLRQWLYPGIVDPRKRHAYNSRSFTAYYTQSILAAIHNNFASLTTVVHRLIPTIHTPYKNHKKFFTNKLLFIYTGAVHNS